MRLLNRREPGINMRLVFCTGCPKDEAWERVPLSAALPHRRLSGTTVQGRKFPCADLSAINWCSTERGLKTV